MRWHAYELRPKGAPPPPPEYLAKVKAMWPRFKQTAEEEYGLAVNVGPEKVDSRPALIGEKFAQMHDLGEAYHRAVIAAYWADARNIADPAVLGEIATGVGLEQGAFLAALADPAMEQVMLADVWQAYQAGLRFVPAMILQGKYLVSGAQPYEYLVRATEKVAAEIAAEAEEAPPEEE